MFQRFFINRTARVLAISRCVLAAFFLAASGVDPLGQALGPTPHAVLALYLLFALTYLAAGWHRWWIDSHWAAAAHSIDLFVFGFLLFCTGGFGSPYFTFFVFPVLAATVRWEWRETASTALASVALYLFGGILAYVVEGAIVDITTLLLRIGYLLVISCVLVWFGLNRRAVLEQSRASELQVSNKSRIPWAEIASFLGDNLAAQRVLVAWSEEEEPWTYIAAWENGKVKEHRMPPMAFLGFVDPAVPSEPVLFNNQNGWILRQQNGKSSLVRVVRPVNATFSDVFDVQCGLHVHVQVGAYVMHVFAMGISGVGADDLEKARLLAASIKETMKQLQEVSATQEAALNSARVAMARDLHDRGLQLLAGLAMKLQAIRNNLPESETVLGRELASMQEELVQEQRELRGLVETLRGGRGLLRLSDIAQSVSTLAERIERQWNVKCTVTSSPPSIQSAAEFEQELHQLVREATANAVRHGGATTIRISMRQADQTLQLEIEDNGRGFNLASSGDTKSVAELTRPWSLHSRVQHLGGGLMLYSGNGGSKVTITLPLTGIGARAA